jgi:hypothetical protein
MKRDDRWNAQKKLIQRITKVTTQILPEGEGVALRFINQKVDNSSNLTLDGIRRIMNSTSWDPSGNSEIGTNLKSKVLEPLVYSKIKDKNLERPLLVSIFTDGIPEPLENNYELVRVILECGNMLQNAGYPRKSTYVTLNSLPISTC